MPSNQQARVLQSRDRADRHLNMRCGVHMNYRMCLLCDTWDRLTFDCDKYDDDSDSDDHDDNSDDDHDE